MTTDDLVRELHEIDLEVIETDPHRASAAIGHTANEIEMLREEEVGMQDLIERQGKLLTGVVNAIRGEPEPLHLHSHHDAVELVRAALSRANENLERAWEHGWNAYAGIVQNRCPQEVFELMTFEKRRDVAALREEK